MTALPMEGNMAKKPDELDEEQVYRELAERVLTAPDAMIMLGLALKAKETGGHEGFDEFVDAWTRNLKEAEARQRREGFRVVEPHEDGEEAE